MSVLGQVFFLKTSTDFVYLARIDNAKLSNYKLSMKKSFNDRKFNLDTIYVMSENEYSSLLSNPYCAEYLHRIDDFPVLVPINSNDSSKCYND